jgi:dolichol-phosphate mannosyltransferase
MPSVSIIVPTLNEAGNIDPLLERIFKVRDDHALDLEVVFVDDASTDGTCGEIRAWQAAYPVRLVSRDFDDGLAGAVMAGARAAKGEYAVVMDADLSHPPEAIPNLLAPLLEGSHDMVIGSRYVPGGAVPEWPLQRRITSKLATLPARFFTDAHDPMAGLFALKRQRLAGLNRQVSGFKIGLEILATAEVDLRVTEVPIVFHDRYKGSSKMNAKVIGDYLRQLLLFVGARFLPAAGEGLFLGLALLLGISTDFALLQFLMQRGEALGTAHVLSYLGSSALVFFGILCFPGLRKPPGLRLTVARGAGFWCVALLVVLLRGGVIELLSRSPGWSVQAAAVAAVLFGALAGYLGNMIFIFTWEEARINSELKWRYLGLAVVSCLFLFRLVYAGLPELLEEEAYYWNYARHMDIGFLDHPPMVAVLIWLGTAAFGESEFGVRAGALLTWCVGAWFVSRFAARSLDRTIAFRSLLLYSILPFFFATGLVMTPEAPLAACWAASLYYLHRALVGREAAAWLGVGIGLGLGMLSKYTMVLLGPATLLFMLLDRQARSWFLRPQPYLAVLLALLLFLPVIVWNARHDWASFVFQGQGRINGTVIFSSHELLGCILLLITPAGFLAFLHFLMHGRTTYERFHAVEGDRGRREYLFALCMILVPLSVFFAFSLGKEVKLNWTGPLWLGLLPYMALTMRDLGRRVAVDGFISWMRRLWPVTAMLLVLFYAACLHYVTLGLPAVATVPGPFLTGRRELAGEVEKIVAWVEEKTGRRPLVVGMDPYQLASSLAFYRGGDAGHPPGSSAGRAIDETLAWHVFGWNGLMYAYWFPPASLAGRDMLLVASRRDALGNEYFSRYVSKTHNIREIPVSRNGRPLTSYYYRLVRGYEPHPDAL